MIICPNSKFVFIHIPKCAGTSIRTQLVKCDPDHISLEKVSKHPTLGKVDYAHIPLSQLQTHFPQYYDYVDNLDSFAMVRDPLTRFGSALRQIMWQYEKRPMTLIPQDEMRDMTLRTLEDVRNGMDTSSLRHIFFMPQSAYIYNNGRRIVDHVIPIELTADLLGYFSKRTGVAFDEERRSNQNVEMRFKSLGNLAYQTNAVLRKYLPLGLHTKIKTGALKVLATKRNAAQASGVLEIPEVVGFVQEHYQQDLEIYQAAMASKENLKAQLKAVALRSGRDPG